MVNRQLMLAYSGPPPSAPITPKKKKCVCAPIESALASKSRIDAFGRINVWTTAKVVEETSAKEDKQWAPKYARYTPAQYKAFGEVVYVSKVLTSETFESHTIKEKSRTRITKQKRVGAIENKGCIADLAQEKLDFEYDKTFGPDRRKTLPKEVKTYERYTYAQPPAMKGPIKVKLIATAPAIEEKPKAAPPKKGKKPKLTYMELVKDGPDIAAFERMAAMDREDRLAKEAAEMAARKAAAMEELEKRLALEAEKVAAANEEAKLKAAQEIAARKAELAEKRAARLAREAADAAMREKIVKEQKEGHLAERRRAKEERRAEDARIEEERAAAKAKKEAQIAEMEAANEAKKALASKFLEYRRRAEQEWLETLARQAEADREYERQKREAREKRDAKERAEAEAEAKAEADRRAAEAARIAAIKWEEEREEREKREAIEKAEAEKAARLKAIEDEKARIAAEIEAAEKAKIEAAEKEEREKAERKARLEAAKKAEEDAKAAEKAKKEAEEKAKKEAAEKAKAEKAAKAAEAKAKMMAEREAAKAAKAAKDKPAAAKKPATPPPPPESDWDCGKVKWEVPPEERDYGTAGKLEGPDLDFGKHESELASVGKLKVPSFGDGGPKAPPPKEKAWKKKQKLPDELKEKK